MNVDVEELEGIIEKNAKKVASLYKRKCWWASHEDMTQEALLAQHQAVERKLYDETFGGNEARYLWATAVHAVLRYVHKTSAPVSTSHRTSNLIGLRRVPTALEGEDGGMYDHPELPTLDGEKTLIAEDHRKRVHARVVELLGEDGAEFALGAMTHEWKPREIAEHHGVSISVVYAAQSKLRSVLISDRALYELWRE